MFLFLIFSLSAAYKPLSYSEITSRFTELSYTCPFLKLTTAQERYQIPYPDNCDNCNHLIVTITNSTSPTAPHVYFSGCLHGDERLGPAVLTELADYLCSEYFTNPWIKRLVDTRLIILTPMTNAVGYYHFSREEKINGKSNDPNRDFPYNTVGKCFETLAARVVASIFEEYLIRIGITYHGGESSVTYPWGSFNHRNGPLSTEAPDDTALATIAKSVVKYSEAEVRVGSMTDIVYPVLGSMEDWAYAGGWDSSAISQCSNVSFTNLQGLRQVLFLVEADNQKSPPPARYGNKEDVPIGGGLIPRYIRMSLSVIDLAEPYIVHTIAKTKDGILVEWELWGCIDVVETNIYYSIENSNNWETWNQTIAQSGGGRWGEYTKFSELFKVESIFIVITAVVDQWTNQTNPDPNVLPQSHIVRARTLPGYKVTHNFFEIVGDRVTKTNIVAISDPPLGTLRALLNSGEVTITVHESYLEINSTVENLYVSKYGDLRHPEGFTPLIEQLCGIKQPSALGIYANCTDPFSLSGRLLSNNINGIDSAILHSDVLMLLPENGGVCVDSGTEITFQIVGSKIVLVSAKSSGEELEIKIQDRTVRIRLENGQGSRYLMIKNEKILGNNVEYKTDSRNGSCIIGIAKNLNVSYAYTQIRLPLWVIIALIVVKASIVVLFIIYRCIKKKQLKEIKYEEVELGFK